MDANVLDVDQNDHVQMEYMYFRRRFMLPRQCQTNGYERLEVTDARDDMLWVLYDIRTSSKGMAELGVGFGLYFDAMFKLAVVTFFIIVVTIPNWSTTRHLSGKSFLLSCDDTTPVCLDEGCRMVGKLQLCGPLSQDVAWLDMLVLALVLLFMLYERFALPALANALTRITLPGARANAFDHDHGNGENFNGDPSSGPGAQQDMEAGRSRGDGQTASSLKSDDGVSKVGAERYAVWVTNPPPDLTNPDEWKDYFEKHFGEVVYVSVAKPNRPLLQLLMQRRRLLQALLLGGSSCSVRVGGEPDDPEGFYLNDADDADSETMNDSRMQRRSNEVRGSRSWIKPEGLKLERDAPWLTGGHAAQSEVLTAECLQEKRWRLAHNPSLLNDVWCRRTWHRLAEIVWGGDLVEDNEYVAARLEEQEVLLHDLNDVLSAVVATRCQQQRVVAVSQGVGRRTKSVDLIPLNGGYGAGYGVAGSNSVYGMANTSKSPRNSPTGQQLLFQRSLSTGSLASSTSKNPKTQAAERAAAIARTPRAARYLSSPTAAGAAAVIVVFNNASDAAKAINALEPPPGLMLRWVRKFWCEFSAVMCSRHSYNSNSAPLNPQSPDAKSKSPKGKKGSAKKKRGSDAGRFEMRPGYAPQVMRETLGPERVRWGAIGGAAFNAMRDDDAGVLRSSHDIPAVYHLGKARLLSLVGCLALWLWTLIVATVLVERLHLSSSSYWSWLLRGGEGAGEAEGLDAGGAHDGVERESPRPYALAVLWVLFMNHRAGPVMKRLTETELHVDEAAHQTWYFHKLALFRVGNTVLTLLYATPRSERFGHDHLAATKLLLLLNALLPPLIKAVDTKYRWRRFLNIKSAVHGKASRETFDRDTRNHGKPDLAGTQADLKDDGRKASFFFNKNAKGKKGGSSHLRPEDNSQPGSPTAFAQSKYPSHLLRTSFDCGDENSGAFAEATVGLGAGRDENDLAKQEATAQAREAVTLRRKAAMMGRESDLADNFSHMVASLSLGLSYTVFVAPAPLLLFTALVLSFYSDRYALTRASACGWVRGAHAQAQTRVALAALHWVGVAVVLHLCLTSAGLFQWPHDDVCPKIHQGRPVFVDHEAAQLRQIRHKILLREVFGHCLGNDPGYPFLIFPLLPNVFPHFWAPEASNIVQLFSSLSSCVCFLLALILWWPRPGKNCFLSKGSKREPSRASKGGNPAAASPLARLQSQSAGEDAGDEQLPLYRDLGARTTAYIPLTVRGHDGLMGASELRALQPDPTSAASPASAAGGNCCCGSQTTREVGKVRKRTVENTLGDFVHFPLIACEPGRGKFVPAHLPWRHQNFTKDDMQEMRRGVTASNTENNRKNGGGGREGENYDYGGNGGSDDFATLLAEEALDAKNLAHRLLLFEREDWPHLGTAMSLLGAHPSLARSQSSKQSVAAMLGSPLAVNDALRASGLFSTIKYFGEDWEGDHIVVAQEEEEDSPVKVNSDAAKKEELRLAQEEEEARRRRKAEEEDAALNKFLSKQKKEEEGARKERERVALSEAQKKERALAVASVAAPKAAREEERLRLAGEESARLEMESERARRVASEEEALRKAKAKAKKEAEKKRVAEAKALEALEAAEELKAAEALALKAKELSERKRKEAQERQDELRLKEDIERAAKAALDLEQKTKAAEAARLKLLKKQQRLKEAAEAKAKRREAKKKRAAERKALKDFEARRPQHTAVRTRDLGGTMAATLTEQRLKELKGLANKRRALNPDEEAGIEHKANLVFMWALEDGDKLTGEVKPWPCTVVHASTVKLSMPEPEGKPFATNERAWGLVFSAFLNTPGTPYRSKLLKTSSGKLTPGTGYMAAALDARVVRVHHGGGLRSDEDSPDCLLDVLYESDTHGKAPSPGDSKASHSLTEVEVPRARVQSREPGGRVFGGAAIKVTKIVQRTFEFVDGASAAEAMATMLRNTPASSSDATAVTKTRLSGLAEDGVEEVAGPGAVLSAKAAVDSRFGLEHGGCVFQVSRPLKVELHGLGLDHGEVTLPTSDAIRVAEKGDGAPPPEQTFPATSHWGGQGDPEQQKVWDLKALSSDGMPLRFVNNRRLCSVVYKLLRFEDIDVKSPKPIKGKEFAAKVEKRPAAMMRSVSVDTDTSIIVTDAKHRQAAEFTGTGPHRDDPVVVHLRPGEVGWVRAPPGVYHLRLAEGRKWFGSKFQFGPSVAGWGGSTAPGQDIDEPFSNYGTSKWQYPPLWLYRTRSGRWCITLDDPTLPIVTVGESGEPLSLEEQAALRDRYMRDFGLYRQKLASSLPNPIKAPQAGQESPEDKWLAVDGVAVDEWEVLKGAGDTSADAEESDDDDDDDDDDDSSGSDSEEKARSGKKKKAEKSKRSVKKKAAFPWQPFPGLRVTQEKEPSLNSGYTSDTSSSAAGGEGGKSPFSAMQHQRPSESSMTSTFSSSSSSSSSPLALAGASGYVISGLPILVGTRGTFLRLAAPASAADLEAEELERSGGRGGGAASRLASPRVSFDGGATSAQRPLLVHGAPVYKYDPRFQFLKDLHTTWREDGGATKGAATAEHMASDEHGRAGPKEGAWWWEQRAQAKSKRAFARETLAVLNKEAGERSEFFRMWHAATFEVPERRIRTVIWPRGFM